MQFWYWPDGNIHCHKRHVGPNGNRGGGGRVQFCVTYQKPKAPHGTKRGKLASTEVTDCVFTPGHAFLQTCTIFVLTKITAAKKVNDLINAQLPINAPYLIDAPL